MNALWNYFWPAFAAAMVIGALAGSMAFRGRRRNLALGAGLALSFAAAALWHGPLGAADRFAARVERGVQQTLVYYEMTEVTGHLQRDPLSRRVLLSGRADDFQQSELTRFMNEIPGVRETRWDSSGGGLPLLLEAAAASVAGFLLGLLLAYLLELRRRHNAQWKW